jgi:hypothetical protein
VNEPNQDKDTLMTDQLNTRDFLVTAGKEALEFQHAEADDFIPTLIVENADHTYDLMALVGGHPYDMLRAIVPTLQGMHPVSLGLTVDSYMLVAEGNPDEAMARRNRYGGSLQAMHEAGEPGVSECLVIHIVTAEGTEMIQLPYSRHRTEGITWDEEYVPPDSAAATGRLIDVLQEVFA